MSKIKNLSSAAQLVTFTLFAIVLWNSASAKSLEEIKSELHDVSSSAGSSVSSGMPLGSISDITATSLIGNHRNMWPIYGFGPKMLQISRSKIPIEFDMLVENDDSNRSKRFDDYGHMRFGKRGGEEQFDDYGHMRFGRSN